MNKLHVMLQQKGGVGKSFIAPLFAEYLALKKDGEKPMCFDLDVSNRTFLEYEEFNPEFINLIGEENPGENNGLRVVAQDKFDAMFNKIAKTDKDIVVDTGSNTFLPFVAYLRAHDILSAFAAIDREIIFHVPITAAVSETLGGLDNICKQFTTFGDVERGAPEAVIVVWHNRFWGPIQEMGVPIESVPRYKALTDAGHLYAVVDLPKFEPTTGEAAIKKLIARRRTFTAAINDRSTEFVERLRYQQLWRILSNNMKLAQL